MKHLQFELCHDGTRLLAIAPADTEVALLELDSGKPKPSLTLLHGHYQGVTSCVYRTNYNQVSVDNVNQGKFCYHKFLTFKF